MTTISGPVVADANILIALLDPQNVHHETVPLTLDRITPAIEVDPDTRARRTVVAFMHPLNMAEVLRGYDAESRDRVLELVESAQVGIVVQPVRDHHAEVLALARFGEHVKMPDACVLALAAATGAPVLTLDKRVHRVAQTLDIPVANLVEPERAPELPQ